MLQKVKNNIKKESQTEIKDNKVVSQRDASEDK